MSFPGPPDRLSIPSPPSSSSSPGPPRPLAFLPLVVMTSLPSPP
jgi:hypothetical protein